MTQQITVDQKRPIFEDAIKDYVDDILAAAQRYVKGLSDDNKSIQWPPPAAQAWRGTVSSNALVYLMDDVDTELDVSAFVAERVNDAIGTIKNGNRITPEQQQGFEKALLGPTVALWRRIEKVRKQSQVASPRASEFIEQALTTPPTNWDMPEKYAFEAAQQIDESLPATLALIKASTYIQRLRRRNAQQQSLVQKARGLREELKQKPITNAGPRGIRGFLRRLLLASINGTPFDDLNWIEVNHEGLQIYTPFSTVSQRTIKHAQLSNSVVVLSVDPPAYLDWYLGVARQFRRNVQSPIGEIVVYEPGSGRTLAKAVALWPDAKIKEMRAALEALHLLDNPFDRLQRLPRLRDILIYYDFAGTDWEELENLLTSDDE